jgi:Fuc2NAc and GlcNAc transferase
MISPIWLIAAAFVSSALLTWLMRRYALANDLLDHPNRRSSHTAPTPRGGGLAIVITIVAVLLVLAVKNAVDQALVMALLVGGVIVASVGFVDDHGSVSARWRLGVHVIAATLAVYFLGGLPPVLVGRSEIDLGWFGDVSAVISIVWVLNLFNFMDGIDGIAGSESVFVCGAASVLAMAFGIQDSFSISAWIVAAASLGFLIWNWPPAKIFMGDVGSGFLGFVIAVLALASARENSIMLLVWLILGGVFFIDATVTLIRRLFRGERIYESHRGHAYQKLSRRWNSHLRVTLFVWGINLGWLLPMAWMSLKYPQWAISITAGSLGPLVILALLARAGKQDEGKA